MSEANWGTNDGPVKKSGLPKWLFWCGGGCLLAVVVGGLILWFGAQYAQEFINEARDPEKQWPKLQQVLPFDERPANYELGWGSSVLMETYVVNSGQGLVGVVMRLSESDKESVDSQLMNPDFSGSFMGMGGRRDLARTTVEVQGRMLDILRFRQDNPNKQPTSEDPSGGVAHSAYVRISTPDEARQVVVQLLAPGSNDPISDEQIREFFAPFHVGSK